MAQPNVAREPSMEEILASIRRIIENNDPVESIENASYSAPRQSASETIELTIDEDIAMMAPDPASQAPLVQHAESVVAPRTPERIEQPAARPMSLADVAARVKAASERRTPAAPANDTDRQANHAPASMLDDMHRAPADEFVAPARSETALSDNAAPASQESPVSASSYDIDEGILDSYEPAGATSNSHSDMTNSAEEAYDVDMDPIERFAVQIGNEIASAVPAQLLSPMTEEKVSRSFEELADALGGSKRSLDEIAEEVLKPMLQEWLDDNLPTLVERLVREEIERVARGPRR